MKIKDRINAHARWLPTWAVYLLGALPSVFIFYQGLTGALGPEPIKALEHEYGEIALQLLIIGLAITPLRRFAGINLLKFRRTIGLLAFYYVTLHLLVWLVLDVQILSQIWTDILKRPYITIGMAAFILMLPLAVTSNNASVRRLGPTWRKLHRLTYIVALLAGLHFIMLSRGFQLEPLLYGVAILGLLATRIRLPRRNSMA